IAEAILPRGIYLVVEHADARIASPAAPFVVSIPMAHPGQEDDPDTIGVDETIEQGTPNYNVHVYPKNESIQIDKSVGAEDDMGEMIEGETGFEEIRTDHRSYNLEEDFPWFIDVSVPTEIYIPYGDSNGNFAEDAGETFDEALQDQDGNIKFKITDVLESELTFIEPVLPNVLTDVVKLYSIDAINALEHDDSKALGAAHYLVTFNAATNTLDVELTPAGRYYIYNENNDGDGDFIKFLRVVFQTEINATAPMHTPIYNNATLDFTNRFGGRWDPYANGGAGAFVPITVEVDADKRPEVHTGQLQIIKTNDETGTALEYIAGAKFKIATSEANAKAGVFIGDDDGDFEAETAAEPVNPGDLPKGYAVIKGLAYGQAGDLADEDSLPTEYWLVETKAPAGYNLLLDPIKVTVAKGPAPDYKIIPVDAAGGTGVVGNADDPDPVTGIGDGKLDDNDYLLSVTVVNSDEFTLPLTGGMGTLLFTVGGIVLIGLAIILFVATKKKKNSAK
ncbi:MAG TPA: hypothetical protein DEQ02_02215, partial [Ruminococcaceae bacterium]|nr:hypothetical protein [Oscillospiraceae bacterium]